MKIIVLIIAAFTLYCAPVIAQTKSIGLDIRGRDCGGGSGLCSIGSTGSKQSNMKNFNITKLSSKSMVIEIEASKLTLEEQNIFFGKSYAQVLTDEQLLFFQEQDFVFDINTLLYLELDPAYRVLKRGTYPIEIVNDTILVSLTLTTQ
ncbi:MAG: hypothetical protein JNJ52_06025 [Flavobacterium sp.]|nr:hypothetical protein [Flavobacterium sp.]